MAQEELEIQIGPDGKVTVRTHGIKGPSCMDWADLMVRIIGREEQRETTAEFYESPLTVQQHHNVRRQRQ